MRSRQCFLNKSICCKINFWSVVMTKSVSLNSYLPLIITLILQTIAALWWAASIDTRVRLLEKLLIKEEEILERLIKCEQELKPAAEK
jgi:hypothetical protein